MKLHYIVIIALFSLFLLLSCEGKSQENNSNTSVTSTKKALSNIKTTYTLKGFKKSCCTGIVNYSLKEVDGFIKSKANVKTHELTVWYDGNKCSETAIKKAINKTPYKIIN